MLHNPIFLNSMFYLFCGPISLFVCSNSNFEGLMVNKAVDGHYHISYFSLSDEMKRLKEENEMLRSFRWLLLFLSLLLLTNNQFGIAGHGKLFYLGEMQPQRCKPCYRPINKKL